MMRSDHELFLKLAMFHLRVLSSQFGNGKYVLERAEAYGDDVSDLFERHGTPDQSFGIWLKDGETSYYEFLSKATGLQSAQSRSSKILAARLSLIVRQQVVWQLDPSAVGRKKYRARSVP
jgi:hypothetical protein